MLTKEEEEEEETRTEVGRGSHGCCLKSHSYGQKVRDAMARLWGDFPGGENWYLGTSVFHSESNGFSTAISPLPIHSSIIAVLTIAVLWCVYVCVCVCVCLCAYMSILKDCVAKLHS